MMTDEEKEAIEMLKTIDTIDLRETEQDLEEDFNNAIDIALNLIDKLQKVIDLMAFEMAVNTESCPLDIYDWENKKYDNCNNCNDTYKECFIEYFYKKVEEEND